MMRECFRLHLQAKATKKFFGAPEDIKPIVKFELHERKVDEITFVSSKQWTAFRLDWASSRVSPRGIFPALVNRNSSENIAFKITLIISYSIIKSDVMSMKSTPKRQSQLSVSCRVTLCTSSFRTVLSLYISQIRIHWLSWKSLAFRFSKDTKQTRRINLSGLQDSRPSVSNLWTISLA